MLGQSFFPGGDEQLRQQQEGTGPVNPVQEAIKILSLKLPRVLGANAPAPPQLLTALGGAGLPNPLSEIIMRAFNPQAMGGQMMSPMGQASPMMGGSPMGGQMPGPSGGSPAPPSKAPDPAIHYMPNPGGTATGTPQAPRSPFSDLPDPLQAGPGKRPTSR